MNFCRGKLSGLSEKEKESLKGIFWGVCVWGEKGLFWFSLENQFWACLCKDGHFPPRTMKHCSLLYRQDVCVPHVTKGGFQRTHKLVYIKKEFSLMYL